MPETLKKTRNKPVKGGIDLSSDMGEATRTGRPKYRQVRDRLYAEIREGRIAPGDSLPTEAKLVEMLGMSRQTVRQALSELENEGIIERVQGRGTFVTTEQQQSAKQQLNVFALIAPRLREGIYPSLVHGFEQSSAGCNHQVLVSSSNNDTERQGNLVLQMIDRSVGGVALVPTTAMSTPAYHVRQLQAHHIPVVCCHRAVNDVSAPCVTWSGEDVGRKAGRLLCELGHRRIAALFSHRQPKTDSYVQGLRDALTKAGTDPQNVAAFEYGSGILMPNSEVQKAIAKSLGMIFAAPNRPTAIFCANLPDAEQVYLQAEEFGLKIPRDLSLIYFGGTWRDHGLAQRISCVAVDEHQVGARAAQLLHEMRSGKRPLDDNEQIVFDVGVLEGETVGPA